ncbi:alpha/beta hydrolase family protein [Actinopolymorpha alba]|uniref:S9 family peptidase n=1 Tax=Actinopolymorpha alba TaxID=533267 RepID=UPI00037097F2|nr:S9 family peptidase [Actinopolymorpha alba]
MKPADLALLLIPGPPTLSPDGGTVVVDVARLDLDNDCYRAQLWVMPTDGSTEPRPLTHGWRDTAPRYSPDGRWLAFLRAGKDGKPQLHLLPTGGGDARAVTTDAQHPLGAGVPVWSPDSTRIAYVARVPEEGRYGTKDGVTPDKEPPRRITTLEYRLDSVGFTLDRRPQVFVVDPFAEEPAPVQVTEGDYDHADVAWSPDSSRLAFVSSRHEGRGGDRFKDVFVCEPDGSGVRQITRTALGAEQPAFSLDGSTVYFLAKELGPDGRDFVAQNTGLYAIPSDGSNAPRRLTDAETYHHGSAVPPQVTPSGVLFGNENRGAIDLLLVPYDGGEPRRLLGGTRQVLAYSAAGDTIVATIATDTSSGELVALRAGEERVLTSFGAGLAAAARLAPMEELTATAPDGYPVHGWLVRPAGEGPHPVLLMIHGGPFAQFGYWLLDEAQVYARAGYAVVMGNPRGSSGYGHAHGAAVRYNVGEVSATDLLALLDRALKEPGLDADRVGVMGGSHGGFMTTWLAGHTDRFRAAVSERAVNAIDSFLGSSDIGWLFAPQYYGEDPAERARQSPLTYADQIDIPMLIIHSEHDSRCPVEQAQRLFVALKSRGVETELLLFPAESHELSRAGLPSHRIARFDAILAWWERQLAAG